jgi:hypothetical protein
MSILRLYSAEQSSWADLAPQASKYDRLTGFVKPPAGYFLPFTTLLSSLFLLPACDWDTGGIRNSSISFNHSIREAAWECTAADFWPEVQPPAISDPVKPFKGNDTGVIPAARIVSAVPGGTITISEGYQCNPENGVPDILTLVENTTKRNPALRRENCERGIA